MATTTSPVLVVTPATGCWSSFVEGATQSANWCGKTVSNGATAVWGGIQRIAAAASVFFKNAAIHLSNGFHVAVAHVKENSTVYTVGAIVAAVAITATIVATRFFDCCKSKEGKAAAAATDAAKSAETAREVVADKTKTAEETTAAAAKAAADLAAATPEAVAAKEAAAVAAAAAEKEAAAQKEAAAAKETAAAAAAAANAAKVPAPAETTAVTAASTSATGTEAPAATKPVVLSAR